MDFLLRLSRDSMDFMDFLLGLSGISLDFHGFPASIRSHNLSQPMIPWIFRPTLIRFCPPQGVFSLTTSRCCPPVGNVDPLLLAVISIGLEGVAQCIVTPLIGTQVVDTVLHIDIGTDSAMTRPEWPRVLGQHPTPGLCLVYHLLLPSAPPTVPVAGVLAVATLTGHLPAPPQLHNIPHLFPIRSESIIPGVPIVVPTHPADFSRKSSWKFDHHMIIPVVEDLQVET